MDPESGAVQRMIESNRIVTGVTWVDGELWHGTWEGEQSKLRRVDPHSGDVFVQSICRGGLIVSGLESDGGDLFFCGGGNSGKVRACKGRETLVDEPRKRYDNRDWANQGYLRYPSTIRLSVSRESCHWPGGVLTHAVVLSCVCGSSTCGCGFGNPTRNHCAHLLTTFQIQ